MTSPSFAITKEMRKNIANLLTQKAISKHGKRIASALDKVNQQFWEEHSSKVDAVLQIDPSRYPELIQSGCLAATSTVEPKANNKCLITISYSSNRYSEEARSRAWGLMITSPNYSRVAHFITRDRYYRESYTLSFISPSGSVPRLNGMELVSEGGKIAKMAEKIRKDIVSVIDAAVDFHSDTTDILNSCRTSRQLIDIFPEAAKLLPAPVKKTTEIAPVELVKSVQGMLKSGIPSKL